MSETTFKNDDLAAFWMPFTPNRAFKQNPRLFHRAEKFHFYTTDNRRVLDGFSGLWCVNLGHGHPKVVEAIRDQASTMDYCPAFGFGHPGSYKLANMVADQFPGDLNHVFFTNSGSEAVDTALKMAIAYHRMRGEGTRMRLIGRVQGYHGVGFGGISVGGMVNNRKFFGSLLPGVDHLSLPYNPETHGYSRGLSDADVAHYRKELETIITLHDASTIAAVIVEPFAGSAGVFVPPKGYMQMLREVTAKHGILLITDEVITGFGRLGAPNAATWFGIEPDLVTMAKAINNAAVPMGAVAAQKKIYDTFIEGTKAGVEFFHGYTYSAHPLAVAAGIAAQEVFREEGVYQHVADIAPYFEDAVHSLKGEPHVTDIRNLGLAGGLTIAVRDGMPGARAAEIVQKAYEFGAVIRNNGDTLALAPILTMGRGEIDEIIDITRKAIRAVA
ncbi:MAG: aminotransferase class III-fold pyridoxal phosphate-dependent enzyme [Alphaproteobacteria bacterium]|nr:MAG: aminotransferase class III-fold pyridoxal phosphate-dependent enzyme [Alphaproteobacteria bacterium]